MNIARIKLVAAVLLLACLALPEYTCSKYVGPDGKVVMAVPDGVPSTPYREVREKHYPLESFSMRDVGSWLRFWCGCGRGPCLLTCRAARIGVLKRLVWLAEPLLSAGSGYIVWAAASLGTRAAGAYLALAANGVYLCAWLADLRASEPQRLRSG